MKVDSIIHWANQNSKQILEAAEFAGKRVYASCERLDSFLIGQEHVKMQKQLSLDIFFFSIGNKKVPFSYLPFKLLNGTID